MFERSRRSPLTDTQLILVDPMFNTLVSSAALEAAAYASAFNVPYSHSLSESELDGALSGLVSAGIVRSEERHGRTVYGLTHDGGVMWEAEREPDWSRYCFVALLPRGPKTKLEIAAFSQERAEQYLRVAAERQVVDGLERESAGWKREQPSPIYWKRDVVPWSATFLADSQHLDAHAFAALASAQKLWGSLSDLCVAA